MTKAKPEQKKAIAEILIAHGANPEVSFKNGDNLLHQCARNADPVGLAYFMEKCQLNPNLPNIKGVSPLEELCHWNLTSYSYNLQGKACIDVLNNHGADPTIKRLHPLIINRQRLNANLRGIYLHDWVIDLIFEDKNNVFSQRAPIPLPTKAAERRQLLTQIYNELGQESVTIELALYPEQLGFFIGEYNSDLRPSKEAIEHIQAWREDYRVQSRNALTV